MMRVHYTVDAAKAQLNSRNVNWPDPGWPLPTVPLAQNVVLMKAQYGVDTNDDNVIDCWTPADNANVCGNGVDYSGPTDVTLDTGGGVFATNANAARLRSIKAVRVAVVVRSEHQERPGSGALGQPRQPDRVALQLRRERRDVPGPHPDRQHRSQRLQPLPDLRNGDPAAQRPVEQPMTPARIVSRRRAPARRQRGVVLFVALIGMVVLSLAAVALLRSVDSGTSIAGNLAFKQASIGPHQLRDRAGRLRAVRRAGGEPHHRPVQSRARVQLLREPPAGESASGVPAGIYGARRPRIRGASPRSTRPEHAGYEVRWVIERMCRGPGSGARRVLRRSAGLRGHPGLRQLVPEGHDGRHHDGTLRPGKICDVPPTAPLPRDHSGRRPRRTRSLTRKRCSASRAHRRMTTMNTTNSLPAGLTRRRSWRSA